MKSQKCDVAIIGSGMGGLCAAALLSHSGYKTIVVESLPFLGGRCSTMEYKGFKLTTGAASIEMGGVVAQIFQEVGADFNVVGAPRPYYRVGRQDYEVPGKGALGYLISVAGEGEKLMEAIKLGLTWMEPSDTISLRQWLLQYTNNEKIIGLFRAIVGGLHALSIDEISAGEFFRFLKVGFKNAGYAAGGNRTLMESLAKAIQSKGGEIWIACKARQIMVDNNVAKGIKVEEDKGEIEVISKVVISNAGPKKTVELAGSDKFDKGYLKESEEKMRHSPYIWISAISNETLLNYPGGLVLVGARRNVAIYCPTLVCPELAPPGKHLLEIGGALESSLPPYNLNREIESTLEAVRENLPGFDKKVEILLVRTFHGEWPCYHSWSGHTLPQKTPIENLYNVGDGVRPQGWAGVPGCAESARLVVEDIKSRIKSQAY